MVLLEKNFLHSWLENILFLAGKYDLDRKYDCMDSVENMILRF